MKKRLCTRLLCFHNTAFLPRSPELLNGMTYSTAWRETCVIKFIELHRMFFLCCMLELSVTVVLVSIGCAKVCHSAQQQARGLLAGVLVLCFARCRWKTSQDSKFIRSAQSALPPVS